MRNLNARLLLAVAVASLGLTTMASAADLPARTYTKAPEYTPSCAWCGWYIGANGGGAWGGRTGSLADFTSGFAPFVTAGFTPPELGAKHEGGSGGAQFGYNWVMSSVLVGFEADIQGADIGRTSTVARSISLDDILFTSTSAGRDHLDWFGTARARLGFTSGTLMFYGTGGLAFGGVESSASNRLVESFGASVGVDSAFAGNSNETRFGWAAGLGLEWMFAPNWSFKAEYLHIDLGSSNVNVANPAISLTDSVDYRFHHEFDSVRVGVNYHFGGPVVAKY